MKATLGAVISASLVLFLVAPIGFGGTAEDLAAARTQFATGKPEAMEAALALFRKVAADGETEPELRAEAWRELGLHHARTKEFATAFNAHLQSLVLGRDPDTIATAIQLLSALYPKLAIEEGSIILLEKALSSSNFSEGRLPSLLGRYRGIAAKLGQTDRYHERLDEVAASLRHEPDSFSLIAYIADDWQRRGRRKELLSWLTQAAGGYDEGNLYDRMYVQSRLASVYMTSPKDLVKAEAACRQIIDAAESLRGMSHQGPTLLREAYERLANNYHERGEQEPAIETLLAVFADRALAPFYLPLMDRLLSLGARPEHLQRVCQSMREQIAADLAAGTVVGSILPRQAVIVDALMNTDSRDEALEEARVYFYICPPASIPKAADLVARAFKAVDMDLVRANRFLSFQRFGPAGEDQKHGTADDLRDVLKEIAPTRNEDRTRMYSEALARAPKGWQGYRHRSTIHLFLNQPLAAFDALKTSFMTCPASQAEMQKALDELTAFVIRRTRDAALAENLAQYIMFRTAGKDGVEGTEDDIENPLPKIKQALAPPKPDSTE